MEKDEGVDELEQRAEELDEQIEETKRDWEQKQDDSSVPGAVDVEPELDEDNPIGGGV